MKEELLLFSQGEISRPCVKYLSEKEEKNLEELAKYFRTIEEKVENDTGNLFRINRLEKENIIVKNYSLAINPSHKTVKNIQELEVTRSLNHNLFSIGIFGITAMILFYLSTKGK